MAEPQIPHSNDYHNGELSAGLGKYWARLRPAKGEGLACILILALAGLIVFIHTQRELDHKEIACLIKLDLFLHTSPRGSKIDWDNLPIDVWNCLPQFLYKEK